MDGRLHYLDEEEVNEIVEVLAHDRFPSTPAFQLAGAEGVARLQSALAQPHWPPARTRRFFFSLPLDDLRDVMRTPENADFAHELLREFVRTHSPVGSVS